MTSWTAWLVAGLVVLGFAYAIYSVYAKKPGGLYISTVIHIVLGEVTFQLQGAILK